MYLKQQFNQMTRWGVQPSMPIYEQKNIILVNYIALLTIPVLLCSSLLVLFWFKKITPISAAQFMNMLLGWGVLWLNKNNKTIIASILICIFPSFFVLFASVMSKLNGISNTLIFAIVPHLFFVVIILIPIVLLNTKKWYIFLTGILPSIIIFIFMKKIHMLLGIDIEHLPYVVAEFDIVRVVVSILIIVITSLIVFLTYLNQQYETEIVQQKDEIAAQRDNLNQQTIALHKAFEEIEDKNNDIMASINYAQRIQAAILPTEEEITKYLPQSFVLFKPRDIVSGDFYFFQAIRVSDIYTKVILAAIDCTGHGVPGAIMSMIGNELLREIVSVRAICEVDSILNELHKEVRKTLKQHESNNKDGMDIALTILHYQDNNCIQLDYAGAMNPLYYQQTRAEHTEFVEIKATKRAIGGQQHEEERLFTKHSIALLQDGIPIGTTFYIFSDGFQDQFGGVYGKKLMVRQFRELLKALGEMSMDAQKQALETTLADWQHPSTGIHYEQVDDILVIGVHVN